ncbi:MAG: CYTH domain-containing protein [Defluviitaleaceae bacterium]|nr:CYTH domain-containing protein [Defluviitaleaceae bacterium]
MKTVEYEKKKLLTEKEFNDKIAELSRFAPADDILQINYYYDTADFAFHKRDETVRIRQKDDKLRFEHKIGKQSVGSTKISKETARSMEILPKGVLFDNIEVSLLGSLITYRTNFHMDNFVISLDKNFYLGSIDFEIEVESDKLDDALPPAIDIFVGTPAAGKYTRFVTALKNMDDQYNMIAN